jgi:hypothetical protein
MAQQKDMSKTSEYMAQQKNMSKTFEYMDVIHNVSELTVRVQYTMYIETKGAKVITSIQSYVSCSYV